MSSPKVRPERLSFAMTPSNASPSVFVLTVVRTCHARNAYATPADSPKGRGYPHLISHFPDAAAVLVVGSRGYPSQPCRCFYACDSGTRCIVARRNAKFRLPYVRCHTVAVFRRASAVRVCRGAHDSESSIYPHRVGCVRCDRRRKISVMSGGNGDMSAGPVSAGFTRPTVRA